MSTDRPFAAGGGGVDCPEDCYAKERDVVGARLGRINRYVAPLLGGAALMAAALAGAGLARPELAEQIARLAMGSALVIVAGLAACLVAQARRQRELERANAALREEIRERRQAEAQHAASEALFRRAFDHAPIGMTLTTLDGR